MQFILLAHAAVAIVAFLIIWRAFDADITAALLMAVIGTAVLGLVIYGLANLGHLF